MGRIKGLKETKLAIRAADREIRGALTASIYQKGLQIDGDSVRICPVKYGRLRATHFVSLPDPGDSNPTVEVGYGTDYAVFVHEMTNLHHANPTTSKFLEKPMDKHASGYTEWIARKTWRNYEAGVSLRRGPVNDTPIDPGPGVQEGAEKSAEKAESRRKKIAKKTRRVKAKTAKRRKR